MHDEVLALFSRYEASIRSAARRAARRCKLSRWADDIEQDVVLFVYEQLLKFDAARNDDALGYVCTMTQYGIRNALRKYRRWDEHELPLLDDVILL